MKNVRVSKVYKYGYFFVYVISKTKTNCICLIVSDKHADIISFNKEHTKAFRESGLRLEDILTGLSENYYHILLNKSNELNKKAKDKITHVLNKLYYNPIIDNRIVHDITFATRLLSFLKRIDCSHSCMNEEEKDYLMIVAKELLDYQKKTLLSLEEYNYFQRLK